MDDDHTLLLNLLNELKLVKEDEKNILIMRICDVINAHSTHEEHLMYDYGLDEIAIVLHLADHHTRFTYVQELAADGKIDAAIKELARHIVKYDVPLGRFINEKQKVMGTS